ncbi:MAG: P-loop NTPase [Candidatus Methanofastidiosia archaeon]
MGSIKHKIIVLSGKGGLGKTTIATNLAYELSTQGFKVGLLDADLYDEAVVHMLGINNLQPEIKDKKLIPVQLTPSLKIMSIGLLTEEDGAPLIVKSATQKKAVEKYVTNIDWGDLDFLIIDPPSGMGEGALDVLDATSPKAALFVTTPQKIALKTTKKAISFAREKGLMLIGLVENMGSYSCSKCGEKQNIFNNEDPKYVAMEMGLPFLGSIPLSHHIVVACDKGMPICETSSDLSETHDFKEIVNFIRIFLEGK